MANAPWLPGEPTLALVDRPGDRRPPRRITQLCGSAEGMFALCNDGTVWQLIAGVWCPEPGIPQRQVAEGEL